MKSFWILKLLALTQINLERSNRNMASTLATSSFNSTLRKCDKIFHSGFKTKVVDFRMAKWDVTCHASITQPATIINDLIIKAHDTYGNLVTAINTLLPQECHLISDECLWFYDFNQDMGPKNPESLRKLELLLDTLIKEVGIQDSQVRSLTRFNTVALCYLHWAMVTKGVYHVSKQVTWLRGKSERYWATILAPKKPLQRKQASTEIKYKGPSHSKENVIPIMKAKVDDIIEKMVIIIRKEDYTFDKAQIVDEFRFSLRINDYLTSQGNLYLGANGAKKLNKLYQELQKARTQLIKASCTAFSDIEEQITFDDGTCVKFKQERKQEVKQEIEERIFSRDVMHVNGGASDEAAAVQDEEEIPDSWEDIAF